jgi:hypothetical protein
MNSFPVHVLRRVGDGAAVTLGAFLNELLRHKQSKAKRNGELRVGHPVHVGFWGYLEPNTCIFGRNTGKPSKLARISQAFFEVLLVLDMEGFDKMFLECFLILKLLNLILKRLKSPSVLIRLSLAPDVVDVIQGSLELPKRPEIVPNVHIYLISDREVALRVRSDIGRESHVAYV